MTQQNSSIWSTLLKANIVQGEAPETAHLDTPWYVKTLQAFSGWFAALLLILSLGMGFAFIIESSLISLFVGALMIYGAYVLLRNPNSDFTEHLGLATSLAGQGLIMVTIFKELEAFDASAWFLIALLQIPLALWIPNFIHRVFSAFVAACAFSLAMTEIHMPFIFSSVIMLLSAWLWLNEFRFAKHLKRVQAIGYGLILALILLQSYIQLGESLIDYRTAELSIQSWAQPWMGELLFSAVMLYVVWQLLQRYQQPITGRLGMVALLSTLLISILSMEAQGITLGVTIILLGFSGSNRVLMGLGILSLMLYISSYYYLLNVTLLDKSLTLLLIGLALLLIRWLLVKRFSIKQEVTDV